MNAVRRSFRILLTLVAISMLAVLLSAQVALAQAGEPTMGLTALQAKLDASPTHSVDGYFKTVMQGSTISTIPCTILGVTGDTDPMDTLILFKATGAAMDDIGGIAEGMSGSPIYVQDDDATWKVVGAVSYGDEFTIGNTGLATPIEAMLDLRATYPPQVTSLSQPVLVDGRVINRVVIAPNPQDFSGAEKTGALVAKPLDSVFIGGLRAGSRPYNALASDLAAKGFSLTARATPGSGTSSLDTSLVPGASLGAFVTRGDMWLGGVGTVTYADNSDVLAFGHPMFWNGPTGLFMTNAYIDGIWPSQKAPYKLARPASLKGTVTQDRWDGIMGDISQTPVTITITSHAKDLITGKTATTSVDLARDIVEKGIFAETSDFFDVNEPDLCWAASCAAAQHLQDVNFYGGSADVTTTVVFGDADTTYTAVLPNTVDSDDLTSDIGLDAAMAASSISGLPASAGQMHVKSMNVDVAMTTKRRGVQMLTVDVPGGLKHGVNHVRVSLTVTATAEPVTADAVLTLPSDAKLGGELWAEGDARSNIRSVSATTAAGLVSKLDNLPSNSVIKVYYYEPRTGSNPYGSPYASIPSAQTSVTTQYDIVGDLTADTPNLSARASSALVNHGAQVTVKGSFNVNEDSSVPDTVAVYATDATHPTEQLLGTAKVTWASGAYSYTFKTPPLTETTRLHVHSDAFAYIDDYGGMGPYSSSYSGYGMVSGDAYAQVHVRAGVSVAASSKKAATGKSITLSARVAPGETAGRTVVFEWAPASGGTWSRIATKTLVAGGGVATASTSWKLTKGTHRVRVRFLGGPTNDAATSASITVVGT